MSFTQAELKNLTSLLTRKGRRRQMQYLADGVRLLEEALRHDVMPLALYYSKTKLTTRGQRLLDNFAKTGVKIEAIPSKFIAKLSEARTPQGIVGHFPLPEKSLQQLLSGRHRNILVCDQVADPGNLGTLLRSALAFDFRLVILTGGSVEPYSPKVVRSTVGALFGLQIAVAEPEELVTFVKKNDITTIASTPTGETAKVLTAKIRSSSRRMLLVGSEASGLSDQLKEIADLTLRIDHSRNVESLNAAVAGSIIMNQIYTVTSRK